MTESSFRGFYGFQKTPWRRHLFKYQYRSWRTVITVTVMTTNTIPSPEQTNEPSGMRFLLTASSRGTGRKHGWAPTFCTCHWWSSSTSVETQIMANTRGTGNTEVSERQPCPSAVCPSPRWPIGYWRKNREAIGGRGEGVGRGCWRKRGWPPFVPWRLSAEGQRPPRFVNYKWLEAHLWSYTRVLPAVKRRRTPSAGGRWFRATVWSREGKHIQ